jgi:arginase
MKPQRSLDIYKKSPVREKISVIGIPFEEGSGSVGLSQAPEYLRGVGLIKTLKDLGIKAIDCGDVELLKNRPFRHKSKAKEKTIDMAKRVKSIVRSELKKGNRILALGGDHAVALGTISGALDSFKGDIGVVWVDAHADICTWKKSITKNIHGMQVASLMGHGDKGLTKVVGNYKLSAKNILYVGLNNLDRSEIDSLMSKDIKTFTIQDLEVDGKWSMFYTLSDFVSKFERVWVSMDLDAVAKAYAPASPMATDEGLSAREILAIARHIGRKANVVGLDIVEWAPKDDKNNRTANLVLDLIAKFFGGDYGWYEKYIKNYED